MASSSGFTSGGVKRDEFSWMETDEPHATRRKEILAKHPEIKELFGPDIRLFPCVILLVSLQFVSAYMFSELSWPLFILAAWAIGGTISHSLSLASHELSHGLAFESITANEILSIIANCAQAIPSSITFKKYHLEHHQKQGYDTFDVDIPTALEGRFFRTSLSKLFFIFMQPFFYALRPVLVYPKPVTGKEIANFLVVIVSNVLVAMYLGSGTLLYMLLSDWLGLGLHPMSGHFISEHYEFVKDQETYSYYGPLNYLAFNVGYHNEHHDFPRISGFRLPEVRRMAPEFYDSLSTHDSWPMVLVNFIMDPSIGPFSRVKRFPTTPEKSD